MMRPAPEVSMAGASSRLLSLLAASSLPPRLAHGLVPAAARAADHLAMRLMWLRLFGRDYDGMAVQRTQAPLDPYLDPAVQADPLRLYPRPPVPEAVQVRPVDRLLDARGHWTVLLGGPDPRESLEHAGETVERVDFALPSAHRSLSAVYQAQLDACRENAVVHGRLYRLRGERPRAAVIFTHGFSDDSLDLSARFVPAVRLARLGVAVAFLFLPWHGPRKPAAARFHGEYFLSADLVRTLESLLQAVSDVRSVAAWLRAEHGFARVGLMGASLGGCVATLTAAVAPEFHWLTALAPAIRVSEGFRTPLGREIRAAVERHGTTAEVITALQRLADPSCLGPAVPVERMLFFAGRGDGFVPPSHLEGLASRWGPLDVRWHPAGHATTLLGVPPARLFDEIEAFLARPGVLADHAAVVPA